ncbi:UbiA family prenyltransferase [Methanobrevibacter acididurans]|uniref:UbiA family prenyltransferase n=1 Tax=Methanobrevibacter acididurans TaxID=120963 RepID=UPI0038FC477F
MNVYLEITRPTNALMAAVAVLLMAIINFNYGIPIILGFITVLFATSGGNVINDFFDYKIDKINKPQRPIPSGRISLKNAKNYSIILFLISILLSGLISYLVKDLTPLILVFCCCLLMYFYARNLKAMPLFGNIAVSLLTALCFIFGGDILAFSTHSFLILQTGFALGFFAFFMTLAREITKDMEDIEGDKIESAETLPIVWGNRNSSILSSILIIITALVSPLLFYLNIFNVYYLVVMIIPIILFLYCAVIILKNQEPVTCGKVSKYLKIGMLISFLAFIIGSIPF